ncbi:hypothetical protein [Pontibacter rugosus]
MPFSKNISEATLAPHVQDALLMNVRPMLGDLYAKVMAEEEQLTDVDGTDLVKAVWVLNAYVKFLPVHGLDLNPAGITKSRDERNTYEQVSPQERQSIITTLRTKLNFYESELGKALKEKNGTGRPAGKKRRIGLRVVGGRS